jgi:hypothetical protein
MPTYGGFLVGIAFLSGRADENAALDIGGSAAGIAVLLVCAAIGLWAGWRRAVYRHGAEWARWLAGGAAWVGRGAATRADRRQEYLGQLEDIDDCALRVRTAAGLFLKAAPAMGAGSLLSPRANRFFTGWLVYSAVYGLSLFPVWRAATWRTRDPVALEAFPLIPLPRDPDTGSTAPSVKVALLIPYRTYEAIREAADVAFSTSNLILVYCLAGGVSLRLARRRWGRRIPPPRLFLPATTLAASFLYITFSQQAPLHVAYDPKVWMLVLYGVAAPVPMPGGAYIAPALGFSMLFLALWATSALGRALRRSRAEIPPSAVPVNPGEDPMNRTCIRRGFGSPSPPQTYSVLGLDLDNRPNATLTLGPSTEIREGKSDNGP